MAKSSREPDPQPAPLDDGGQLLVHPDSLGQQVNLRRWFDVYLMWLGALTVLAITAAGFRQSGFLAYRGWLLACLAFYLSLACTFVPLPTSPAVALAAVPTLNLAPGLWPRVLLIAAVGAVGTMMANLNDYHLFTFMLAYRKVASIRKTRLYRAAIRWFNRSAWWTLVAFTFIPFPVDVVRLLAITFRYPRWRFATACYVGRFVRYAILAWTVAYFGSNPRTAWWLVIGITVLTVGLGVTVGTPRLIRLLRGTQSGAAVGPSNGG